MWYSFLTPLFDRRVKKYGKKHSAATAASMDNLRRLEGALQSGVKPAQLQGGFIHREPMGIIAVDQTAASRKYRETRVYVYPQLAKSEKEDNVLYVLTIGDKNTQQRDILDSQNIVKKIEKGDFND